MTNADLQFLTVDQWVHRFADIGVQQDKAEQPNTIRNTNGFFLK